MRQGLGTGALAAITVAVLSFAAGASPLMKSRPPSDSISRTSPVHQALIYAKEGSQKLVDGRWNLSQSEAKLGIELSADEKEQLMACTGEIVCHWPPDDDPRYEKPPAPITASAASVLRPDLLVTAKHVFFKGKRAIMPFGRCSFRSYLHRRGAIPVRIEKDQRRGYVFNNEDFVVLGLKRELKGCKSFAIPDSDTSMPEGEHVFSVTGRQRNTLNRISRREPVVAKGKIRNVFNGYFGGPPFYPADIDFDIGGSGGAAFALKNGRPVSDEEGRLILRGILVAYGLKAKNNRPYSEERNFTIIIGLRADFRELVEGKAQRPAEVEPVPCWLQGGVAKIDVVSNSVPPAQSDTLAPALLQFCKDRKTGKAKACKEPAKGLQLAGSQRGKQEREFRLKNDTACPVCFTYRRCNDYGCWDEAVRLSGRSLLFAGVGKRAPVVRNPQFCKSGRGSAVGPPLPPRKPVLAHMTSPPPLRPGKPPVTPAYSRGYTVEPEAKFLAAKEKAERDGVHALTSDDIRGLSLNQIRELRGY